jgi:hypothetical protein
LAARTEKSRSLGLYDAANGRPTTGAGRTRLAIDLVAPLIPPRSAIGGSVGFVANRGAFQPNCPSQNLPGDGGDGIALHLADPTAAAAGVEASGKEDFGCIDVPNSSGYLLVQEGLLDRST